MDPDKEVGKGRGPMAPFFIKKEKKMKLLVLLALATTAAHAQLPGAAAQMGGAYLKEKTAKVMKACAEDKKNVKGCESYTELAPLKECLMKNKDALSAPCKTELTSK